MVLQIGRQYVATAPVISNGMIVLSAYTPFQVLSRSFSNKIEIAPVHKGKTGPKDRAEQVDLLDLLVLTLYPLERPEDREHGEDAPVADWMRGQLLFTNQDHTEGDFKVTGPHFWYIEPSDLEQRAYAWFLRQGPSARKRLLNLLQVLEDIDDGPLTLPEI